MTSLAPVLIQSAEPLIRTKLTVPQPRDSLVSRPRLLDLAAEGLARPLTLVCAPAGYGKTSLLVEWIHRARSQKAAHAPAVGWLSLDEGDNDPIRFLSYLVAACESASPGVGAEGAWMLSSVPPPEPEAVLALLLNALDDLPTPVLLVLDDYQFISNASIHAAIAFLLAHLPAHIHLAIITRSDPPLPLARLRARGQLTEIRAGDLRFTRSEIVDLLRQGLGLELAAADLARLEERTEGWIVGLKMAALAIHGLAQKSDQDLAQFVQRFSGSHRYILDYLAEEVLSQQPVAVQRFLLQTAILEDLCGPLCEAVVEGQPADVGGPQVGWETRPAQQVLEYLDRSNLFLIPLDSERIWYRYHHLFADLLRARLEQQFPAEVPGLHRRAAHWYARNQRLEAAVAHAFSAGEVELAAGWIEAQVEYLLVHNGISQLSRWIERLPAEIALRRPWLCIARGWYFSFTNQAGSVEPYLSAAEQAIRPEHPAALQREWQGHIACMRAQAANQRGDQEGAIAQARRALEYLRPDDVANLTFARYTLGRAYLDRGELDLATEVLLETVRECLRAGAANTLSPPLASLARAYRMQGRLRALRELLEEGRSWIESANLSRATVAGVGLVGLAEALREANDLPAAEALGRRSLELSLPWYNPSATCSSYTLLCRVLLAQGKTAEAERALRQAEESVQGRRPFGEVQADLDATRLDFWLATGRADQAAEWIRGRSAAPTPQSALPVYREADRILAAQVMLAEGRSAEALPELEALAADTRQGGRLGRWLEITILKALAYWFSGDMARAFQNLEQSLELAEQEGYRRIYLDKGPAMTRLLSAYIWSARPARGEYAQMLLAAAGQAARREAEADSGVEALTNREQEILTLIAAGLSNRQVAEKLFLSEGTVKFYVHSVLAKLGVQSRTQAAARARELGLI